jgi:hypothetical protein
MKRILKVTVEEHYDNGNFNSHTCTTSLDNKQIRTIRLLCNELLTQALTKVFGDYYNEE